MDEPDLYELLGVSKGASQAEIKKAYHKAARSNHPDKVEEEERAEAEIKFKQIGQAYDILYDDQKRAMYDEQGMAAFEGGSRGGAGGPVDLDELFDLFGMGGGGAPPGFGGASMPRQPRKGKNEEQVFEITLEELFKGKTTKFASTKNIVCSSCHGSGGKEHAKSRQCATCQGKGSKASLRSVGPGLVTQTVVTCGACSGSGKVFRDKDRCRKCKGTRVVEARKVLELYVPRGSNHGEKIVLEGEADQVPDQEPGDIVFTLFQKDHDIFTRVGQDLMASFEITLTEALCGFSRVVIKHLDGRGLRIEHHRGKIVRPEQTFKIGGEGMHYKKSDSRGDLYLNVKILFPEDGYFKDAASVEAIQKLLPGPPKPISAEVVDVVEYDADGDYHEFGSRGESGQDGNGWEDEEEFEGGGPAECAQQ